MKILLLAAVFLLGAANGGGCSDPNHIGVQEYGTIVGRVIDARTNAPIGNALVSVGSLYTASTDNQGAFILKTVPAGDQTVSASAPGYTTETVDVDVKKDQTVSADYIKLPAIVQNPQSLRPRRLTKSG
ncbi:MAG: carboxypeptidase-like regulatory domain-containing protein [Candidatus Eremiobacteraeota bacterium]|nr:carboxypeptidase-like regulatory domain-containing protein [Candidatus Eremiobacteraeota bacterium]